MNFDKGYIQELLEKHVMDTYQRFHALMVATAMEGYAKKLGHDPVEWYAAGLLHDMDYQEFPTQHPGPSLEWLKEWGCSEDFCHAIESHAYGYNGFTTLPNSPMAHALMACDEISGIFYAYKQMNPVNYGDMKVKSIVKKYKDKSFAAKINRADIDRGCEGLGVELRDHIENLIQYFTALDT